MDKLRKLLDEFAFAVTSKAMVDEGYASNGNEEELLVSARTAIETALQIGQLFANIAYNWKHAPNRWLSDDDRAMLAALQKRWDEALK